MKVFLRTSLILLITALFLNAQNYLWPTNAGRSLSSTFGEYRSGHFHSGIDIKTNYKTGFPVYAISDGYVWRVRTSPFGYGKAVYIKLKDGNFAVYGHLDEFAERILPYVRAEQFRNQRYSTDIFFSEYDIQVKRGDVLGFTGDTGSEYPHLHFEIRDNLERPLNPLNKNYRIDDLTMPTIKAIALVPLEKGSRINGSPRIQIFPVKYADRRIFTVEDTIQICGPVGIEVKVHDTVRGVPNRYAPYGIKLFIDDSLRFFVQYDMFDFEMTRYVDIDRDYQLIESGSGYFNRLWKYDQNVSIPFYRTPSSGIINLPRGYHTIEIKVYDHNRNTSTLRALLFSGLSANPGFKSAVCNDESCEISIAFDTVHTYRDFYLSWVTRHGDPIRSAALESMERCDDEYVLSVSNYTNGSGILKIQPVPSHGGVVQPLFLNLGSSFSTDELMASTSFIHNPGTFLCVLKFKKVPAEVPKFFLQSEDLFREVELLQESPVEFITCPVPLSWWKDAISIEIKIPGKPAQIIRLPIHFKGVYPGIGEVIFSQDSIFSVAFSYNSVHDTLLTWVSAGKLPPLEGGKFETGCYDIYPRTQPLKNAVSIMFRYPIYLEELWQIGIYRLDEDEWEYLESSVKVAEGTIFTDTDKLRTFCMIRDTTSPVISNIFPGDGGKFRPSSVTVLKANVVDDLSGIKDDAAITVALDGKTIIAEYHGIQDYIRYKLTRPLSYGWHTVTITAEDQAGNKTTDKSDFFILSQ